MNYFTKPIQFYANFSMQKEAKAFFLLILSLSKKAPMHGHEYLGVTSEYYTYILIIKEFTSNRHKYFI